MDQDAFRQLIQTPRPGTSSSASTSRVLGGAAPRRGFTGASSKPKVKEEKKPANVFKPRKVKKADDRYRDRAAERRGGVAGDFADAEQMLAEFEARAASGDKDEIEKQRAYLGGDAEHSILVKGLDYSLLAAQKRNLERDQEDVDDELESAFASAPAVAEVTAPKKRSRDDVLRELKERRAGSGTPAANDELERAKKMGKFRPIGFKEATPAKRTGEPVKKKKKKKNAVAPPSAADGTSAAPAAAPALEPSAPAPPSSMTAPAASPAAASTAKPSPSPPRPARPPPPPKPNLDDNIFSDAGEYVGADLSSDDESDDAAPRADKGKGRARDESPEAPAEPARKRNWFGDAPSRSPSPLPSPPRNVATTAAGAAESARPARPARSPSPEVLPGGRLQGFASSALPSVRDLLEMDKHAEAAEKRKERKEAWKKKQGIKPADGEAPSEKPKKTMSDAAKTNREYQQLQSYMSKRGGL